MASDPSFNEMPSPSAMTRSWYTCIAASMTSMNRLGADGSPCGSPLSRSIGVLAVAKSAQ
eukprot:1173397-Amphidinium_carterae.1